MYEQTSMLKEAIAFLQSIGDQRERKIGSGRPAGSADKKKRKPGSGRPKGSKDKKKRKPGSGRPKGSKDKKKRVTGSGRPKGSKDKKKRERVLRLKECRSIVGIAPTLQTNGLQPMVARMVEANIHMLSSLPGNNSTAMLQSDAASKPVPVSHLPASMSNMATVPCIVVGGAQDGLALVGTSGAAAAERRKQISYLGGGGLRKLGGAMRHPQQPSLQLPLQHQIYQHRMAGPTPHHQMTNEQHVHSALQSALQLQRRVDRAQQPTHAQHYRPILQTHQPLLSQQQQPGIGGAGGLQQQPDRVHRQLLQEVTPGHQLRPAHQHPQVPPPMAVETHNRALMSHQVYPQLSTMQQVHSRYRHHLSPSQQTTLQQMQQSLILKSEVQPQYDVKRTVQQALGQPLVIPPPGNLSSAHPGNLSSAATPKEPALVPKVGMPVGPLNIGHRPGAPVPRERPWGSDGPSMATLTSLAARIGPRPVTQVAIAQPVSAPTPLGDSRGGGKAAPEVADPAPTLPEAR